MGRVLCIAGGFGDGVGYMLLKSMLCASITGNIVKAASALSERRVITSILVVSVAYGLGSLVSKIVGNYLKTKDSFPLSSIAVVMFLLEMVFIVVTILAGSILWPLIRETDDINHYTISITGGLLAMAMGAQV